MAPVVLALARRAPSIVSRVCVTGQHREMLDDVLRLFRIEPDHDLDVMRRGQSPTQVAVEVLRRLEPVLVDERPDWVIVQGDTTTAAMAALGAFYAGARVAHVEAGLRSHEPREPFPEEVNRRLAAVIADLHFAPTPTARRNLLMEGTPATAIHVTGNTVIDALHHARQLPIPARSTIGSLCDALDGQRIVLVTAHRRESFGAPLQRICDAVNRISRDVPDVHVVFPAHPSPAVRAVVDVAFRGNRRVTLLEPLGYRDMVELLDRSSLVLTDSGGLQEEAPSLGKPVLVLREVTERREGIEAGTVRLVGTDPATIVSAATLLLGSPQQYAAMSRAVNPYGDGHAAERIVRALAGDAPADLADDAVPSERDALSRANA